MSEASETETTAGLTGYVVHLRRVTTKSVEISAASPEEAVALVKARQKEEGDRMSVESVEEARDGGDAWEVDGGCESCGLVLLSGNEGWVSDGEIDLCAKCAEAQRGEEA